MRRASNSPAVSATFPAPGHDHGPCLKSTLQRAAEIFEANGLKLTPLRRRVLEEVAASHHAVGAYEILERLSRKERTRMAPISVYRALEALLEMGVVHRLESRNAYFACHAPHGKHAARQIVLACERCATVAEVAALLKVNRSWVYEHTRLCGKPRSDRLPHIKLGKYVRFDPHVVRAFLDRQTAR